MRAYLSANPRLSFDSGLPGGRAFSLQFSWGLGRFLIARYLSARKRVVIAHAGLLIAAIAAIDWRVDLNLSFGFLYLFPILLLATVMSRWQILGVSLFCTFLSDLFDPFPFLPAVSLPDDILVFTALAGGGLLAFEMIRSRRQETEHRLRLEKEAAARRAAEEQLAFLIDSSPAAILTMSAEGDILLANSAAHRMLAMPDHQLAGKNIGRYIPALGCVPSLEHTPQAFRTQMQCRGEREGGDIFLANVFFSTYRTAAGPRLAALIVDGTEELREREESSLEQLLDGSRILVGAVSHEIRNVCGAIAIIYENLARAGQVNGSKDFEALGALVETLHKIAALELKQSAREPRVERIDLAETMEDLRIVLEPLCQDADIEVRWEIPESLPPVRADRHKLLQVLLNLTKNSQRALERAEVKRITVSASAGAGLVSIRIGDTGPGIASPGNLFQPFQRGAEATGLGLYLSRAFVRSFGGELRHEAAAPGCSFVIDLPASRTENGTRMSQDGNHTTVAAR